MKLTWDQVYTSAACNRTPEIVDWNNDGILCYGACNAVVICDTRVRNKDPLTVLSHHSSRVNSIKWLRNPNGSCYELVSASADKTAAVWTLSAGEWKVTSKLTGHTNGVTCVFGVYTGTENDLIIFTGSIDSTVKVWERNNGTFNCIQTINLNSGLCLTLHAHLLRDGRPVLFCALDDHKIHIFSGDEYHRVHTLIGHEDWVRGLDVLEIDVSTILLASASQDTYIRLWRIQQYVPEATASEIKVEEKVFQSNGADWSVKLEAVLAGHEGWVYGVQWQPSIIGKEKSPPNYRLLSSSLDKTLIVWEPEMTAGGAEGAWQEKIRVGEVGGNGLGFYGSRFGPNGTSFLGHGYNGSFHIWKLDEDSQQWQPQVVPGGHYGPVEDVCWEPNLGRYLISVSADQTARAHAPWTTKHGDEWHEIARPQVHGYDMASLTMVSSSTYASAAEEKVIRVFKAPHNFASNFKNIVGKEFQDGGGGEKGPEGASVPSLGLSNKAVFTEDEDSTSLGDDDGYFVPVNLTQPPTEETLMQNTLWWEQHKVYGHGYEVHALAAAADGTVLASACRATNAEHAAPVIWDTSTWQQVQKLPSHQLTVTQLSFSPDSQYLLSVSRDRRWFLFRRRQGSNQFDAVANTDKTNGVHARIIWCCAWDHESRVFATGSRDGKVCAWSKADAPAQSSLGEYGLLGKPLELANTSVTAVAFAQKMIENSRIIATGFESGIVRIYAFNGDWSLLKELDNSMAHHQTVKRLAFQPGQSEDKQSKDMLLASCASDHFVRIHRITID